VHIGRSCRLTRAELKRFRNRVDAAAAEPARRSRRAMPTSTATQVGLFDVDPTPPDAA
jgi:hypothetical protein